MAKLHNAKVTIFNCMKEEKIFLIMSLIELMGLDFQIHDFLLLIVYLLSQHFGWIEPTESCIPMGFTKKNMSVRLKLQ